MFYLELYLLNYKIIVFYIALIAYVPKCLKCTSNVGCICPAPDNDVDNYQ